MNDWNRDLTFTSSLSEWRLVGFHVCLSHFSQKWPLAMAAVKHSSLSALSLTLSLNIYHKELIFFFKSASKATDFQLISNITRIKEMEH